jgi:tetratricopeptide (TPR) repeat protein
MRHFLLVSAAVLFAVPMALGQGQAGTAPAKKAPPALQELILSDSKEALRAARKNPDQVGPAIQAIFDKADLQITHRQIADARVALEAADRFLQSFAKTARQTRVPTEALQGRLARLAGIELIDQKQYAEAEKKLRGALDLSRRANDAVLEAGVHNNLGLALRYGNPAAKEKLEEAAKEFEAARTMAEAQKDPLRAGSYNFNLGQALLAAGRPEEALQAFRRSAEQNKAAAKPDIEARAVMFQAVSLSRMNAVSDEPVKLFEAACRMFLAQKDERNAGWSLFSMAEHYAYGGKPKEAAVAGERAVPLLLKANDKPGLTRCYTLLGEMYDRLDDKVRSGSYRKKLTELSAGK